MEKYLEFVAKYPRSIIFSLVAITLLFGFLSGGIKEDSNPYLIPEDHPARAAILEMREDFTGTYDAVLIAVHNPDGIFNQETLNAIYSLTQSAKRLSFGQPDDIEIISSLAGKHPENEAIKLLAAEINSDGLNQNDGVSIRRLLTAHGQKLSSAEQKELGRLAERLDPIRELAGMAATENVFLQDDILRASITLNNVDMDPSYVQNAIMKNELMERGVVNEAGTVGLIVIEVSILQDDAAGQLRAYETIKQMVDDYRASHSAWQDDVYVGGVPVFFAEQKKIMDADMATLVPVVLLLVAMTLAVFFKSFLGVLVPLVNVVMCTIWTFGFMAIVGIPIDLITAALPVFLITICSSDAIHVMAEYYYQRQVGENNLTAVKATMRLMTSPVILTTVTTCVTFLLSTTTSISNLRNFGMCMSFGMFVALVISLLLIPAWLALLNPKMQRGQARDAKNNYFISKILLAMLTPVIKHRIAFLIGFTALVGLLTLTAVNVRIDDMGSGYFAKDNEFRISDDFINENVAGTSPAWIEIDSKREDGAITMESVQFVDKLEKYLQSQENVTFSYSIAKYIRRINFVLNDMDPSFNRLPEATETLREVDPETGETLIYEIDGNDIIRQSILMYENGGGSDLTNVLSGDFSKTVILFTMNTTVASEYSKLLDKLEPWLAENTPDGMTYKIAGTPVIWTTVLDELISGQLLSILLAFSSVVIIMSLWLKSLRMGIIGTLPLAVTVVFYYAAMTVFNIELNIGTAIISFLVLGVVDYSVHYLLRTVHNLNEGKSLDDALIGAITYSGRSIIANVFVFSIGFLALTFSAFRPIVDLGSLVGLSLLVSGIMSLFVITLLAPWLIPTRRTASIPGLSMAPEDVKQY